MDFCMVPQSYENKRFLIFIFSISFNLRFKIYYENIYIKYIAPLSIINSANNAWNVKQANVGKSLL